MNKKVVLPRCGRQGDPQGGKSAATIGGGEDEGCTRRSHKERDGRAMRR